MSDLHKFIVTKEDVGLRLDQYLAKHVPGLSRRKARVVLDIGGVFVDSKRVKVAGRMVRAGQSVRVNMGGALARASQKTGKDARAADDKNMLPFEILHEDADVVVVNKPAGLLSAPTPESDRGNLADALKRQNNRDAIFVVHRLDMATSGILVFAKTDHANQILSKAFKDHTNERVYTAIVAGQTSFEEISVDAPIGEKHALTHLRVLTRLANATILEAKLETGRTHQIRIHCEGLGHPVLGDRKYGHPAGEKPPQMALHARALGFKHPTTNEALHFTKPIPPKLQEWVDTQPR